MSARVVAIALTAANIVVVVGPAAVLAATAHKGGLAWTDGLDLVVASAVVAAAHGVLVWRRLRRAPAAESVDAALAGVVALTVVALLCTTLVFVLLGGLAPEQAAALGKGWHVTAAWAGLQLVAVAVAAATQRGLRSWLRAAPERRVPPADRRTGQVRTSP